MNFSIVKTNIINVVADAVVLPANVKLKEGSGTSAALFKAAGREQLSKECEMIVSKTGALEIGDAIPSLAFDLNAQYIIHTVVPKWIDGKSREYEMLCEAYLSALNVADLMKCKSIAFPLLASGNNNFDLETALEIADKSFESFEGNYLKQIILVIYGEHIASVIKTHGYQYIEFADSVKKTGKKQTKACNGDIKKTVVKEATKAFDYIKKPENRKKLISMAETIVAIVEATKTKNPMKVLDAAKKL